jgi:UDP-N-acetylmuramoyl-L-alanyl-D-glutamate--2,6-diaminopimelate ligase
VQLEELLTGVEVVALRGDGRVDVVELTHDSRRVRPGACFACVVGASDDGHRHAPAAVAAGAVALLVQRPVDAGVTEAEVADVRRALGPVASTLHGNPSRAMRCLGVTGTNGKTTTTYLLEAIAQAAGERVGVVGTTGAWVGDARLELGHTTPEATDLQALLAFMRDDGVRTVAIEVSSHALAQHRVDGTWLACAGFTNLSHDHLDFHGTMDEYFEAKATLFAPDRAAAAAVNVDDDAGRAIAQRAVGLGVPTTTFGLDARDADVAGEHLRLHGRGAELTIRDRRADRAVTVQLSLVGRPNVMNALTAAAMAVASGTSVDAVGEGLSCPIVVPGRLETVDAGQPFAVLVDYAHAPDALASTLATARELAASARVIVVFGCGGDRDRGKRPLMGRAAADAADVAILTSDNPRSESPEAIAAEVLVGMEPARAQVVTELDRRAAITLALGMAAPGDVVVIAGKGHETGQTTGGTTVPFDDRVVAREELGVRT